MLNMAFDSICLRILSAWVLAVGLLLVGELTVPEDTLDGTSGDEIFVPDPLANLIIDQLSKAGGSFFHSFLALVLIPPKPHTLVLTCSLNCYNFSSNYRSG